MFKVEFSRCFCIIDCSDVFCERPSELARAQTFSNYKHYNTRGWGGRLFDKHLTEDCGLLTLVQPGDQVMADRGCSS